MNLLSLLSGIAVIGASVLALEGANQITQGEFYLASVSHLAQESAQSAATIIESQPPATQQPSFESPTPTTESSATPIPAESTVVMPTPTPGSSEVQKPSFPPQPILDEADHNQGNEQDFQEFIDPNQIRDGLRNMNQFRNELRRTIREVRRQASPTDLNELSGVLADVDKLYSVASNSSNLSDANDAVREFYDNQFWDKINDVRARLQIPNEIKQITQSIKRLEKVLKTKSIQNIGLDIAKAQSTLVEMKQAADNVQNLYNAGEYQNAQEEMRLFHEGGHPGEIEGVIFRIRDIKNMAKRVKDAAVKTEIDGVLQEVIDTFNAGEYRDARETLDEYADDLQRLISQFVRSQSRRGYNRNDSVSRVKNLEDLVVKKLSESGASTGAVNPFSR
ncbi:MAG: hypothetical protein HYV66_00650 [Candidatus Sungbacteria bacterium]|uniref:DUF5667 domain-containing protein n=1 Tax=Candidatus Sungiibacteriota bacterium TaxID=2750080 RepID=A0A931YD45_9BACT|nr:hypothetical protein [Candidatus Sungbacteria bacterium]